MSNLELESPAHNAYCNLLDGLKVSTPAMDITALQCWHIGRNVVDRITELEAQLADLENLKVDIANALQSIAEYDQENASLKSQLADAQKDAWQPIETAPKDGTEVLLKTSRTGRIANGLWNAVNSEHGFWVWAYIQAEPAHWMPLPKMPTDAAMQPKEQAT